MPVADTSFLLDVLERVPAALVKLDELIRRRQAVWIPAPSLHELYYGAGLHARRGEERARVEQLEAAMPPLPFDAPAARIAGALEADGERAGRRPHRVDAQIAAIALARGDSVVTRDKRFPSPPGLALERY